MLCHLFHSDIVPIFFTVYSQFTFQPLKVCSEICQIQPKSFGTTNKLPKEPTVFWINCLQSSDERFSVMILQETSSTSHCNVLQLNFVPFRLSFDSNFSCRPIK